jgi:hypothetical protein
MSEVDISFSVPSRVAKFGLRAHLKKQTPNKQPTNEKSEGTDLAP